MFGIVLSSDGKGLVWQQLLRKMIGPKDNFTESCTPLDDTEKSAENSSYDTQKYQDNGMEICEVGTRGL